MYVYTKVLVQRSNVYALPQQALMVSGNQTYCYLLRTARPSKRPSRRASATERGSRSTK